MANATHAVVHDMKAKFLHPPAKKAELRAKIERFFRTVHDSFTPFFAGQTYRNVVEKGDYDSKANVCLCIDEFAELFGRWVIDVYHNTPHDSLNGKTPRNAWLELTEKYPVQMPPSPEERRHIFGMRCERRIEKRGIRIMGIYYQSKALQQLRKAVGQVPISVKVDRYDLSEISVWNQEVEAWMHVPPSATDLELRGVTYWEWVAAARDLQRKNIDTSNLASGTVYRAIQDIRQESDEAIQRAGLHSHIMNLDDLNRVERDHFATFNYVSSGGAVTDEPIDELAGFALDAPTAQDDLDPKESSIPVDGDDQPGNSADSETDWSWE
jgi:putative transposase